MKFLGIDYGRRKIGLAVSDGKLAEPYQVIRYRDWDKMIAHIQRIIEKQKIEKVVVGISEGEMAKEQNEFAKQFRAETFDETLSSHDAQVMSIQSGMGRKKRREMEDAFAATIMLQSYLDNA
ncbi:MAG: Holliday junction resolvase RuvX [bacterium]|nr:MAG: Holliday junction resolvase RuvX [bacterium]